MDAGDADDGKKGKKDKKDKKGKKDKDDDPSKERWKLKPPEISGFLQVFYRYAFDTSGDGVVDFDNFRVQRVRIKIEGEVFRWLSYDIEIDPRAPLIGGVLRDAYLDFKLIPRHKLRIGLQKMLFGYENAESSSRLFAVNRTEVSENLSRGVNLRDVGIGLMGNIKLGGGFRIEDAITLGNGAGLGVQDDNTRMKNLWGRLGLRYKNDDWGDLVARAGVSGGYGDLIDEGLDPMDPADDFRLRFARVGFDVTIDQQWFFVSAEYVFGWDVNTSSGETDNPFGYYLNVVGKTPWNVGPIIRYDALTDEFKRLTFGVYYGLPDAPFRVMANYEYRLVRDGARVDDKLYLWAQLRF